MAFNPLRERGIPIEKQFRNWSELNVKPYNNQRSTRSAGAAASS
jgi:hypothetical protein